MKCKIRLRKLIVKTTGLNSKVDPAVFQELIGGQERVIQRMMHKPKITEGEEVEKKRTRGIKSKLQRRLVMIKVDLRIRMSK